MIAQSSAEAALAYPPGACKTESQLRFAASPVLCDIGVIQGVFSGHISGLGVGWALLGLFPSLLGSSR